MWNNPISYAFIILNLLLLCSAATKQVVMRECNGNNYMSFTNGLFCEFEQNYLYYCDDNQPKRKTLDTCDLVGNVIKDEILPVLADCSEDTRAYYECKLPQDMTLIRPSVNCQLVKFDKDNCEKVKFEAGMSLMKWMHTFDKRNIVFRYNDRIIQLRGEGDYEIKEYEFKKECEEGGLTDPYVFECVKEEEIIDFRHNKIVYTDNDGNPMYEEITRNVCSEEDELKKRTVNYKEYALDIVYNEGNCRGTITGASLVQYSEQELSTFSTNAYSFKSGSLILKTFKNPSCDDQKFRKAFVYYGKNVCDLETDVPEFDVRYINETHYKRISCEDSSKFQNLKFDKCYSYQDKGYFKVENLWISPVIEKAECDEYDVSCIVNDEVHLEDKFIVKYMHLKLTNKSKVYMYPTPNSTIRSEADGHIIIENTPLMMSMNQEKYDVMMDILEEEEGEVEMKIIDGSYEGSFSELIIEMDDDIKTRCETMENENFVQDDKGITIAFKMDKSNCKFPGWAIGLISVGAVVVVAGAVAVVAIVYEPFRKVILPFRRT